MKKQKGFTLIEIMLSLLLGIIVIGGALSIYILTIKGSSDTVKSARLNYDRDFAMQFMINDIRRAGYWGGAVAGSVATDNPFINTTATNIQLLDPIVILGTTFYRCILYTYDADADAAVNNGEFFGFKLDSNTIKSSSADTVDAVANCGATDSRWMDILDSDQIEITSLTFSNSNYKCLNTSTSPDQLCSTGISIGDMAVETRQIDITLIGRVKNDNSVTKTLTGTVKVRNNRIYVN